MPQMIHVIKRKCLWLAKLLFWPLVIAAAVGVALERGALKHEETHLGPFIQDGTPGSRALLVRVGETIPFRCCLEARSDFNARSFPSDLRLWLNGHEMGPGHRQHIEIRAGGTEAFSHWVDYVMFSLPHGVAVS